MNIGIPYIRRVAGETRLCSEIVYRKQKFELFYSVASEYEGWFSTDRCDAFVVAMILQAMSRNENIEVEGALSSRLIHSLEHFFIPMMSQAFEPLHSIKISPASLISISAKGGGVGTGFSGGIDSFTAVIQHLVRESSVDHKVNALLFNNVGSHGSQCSNESRILFRHRYALARVFADEIGVPLVAVDSNVGEIFPIDFIRMHPALNASVALALQGQFQRFYYASTYKYADCGVNRTDDIARFDPLAFHLFSTESLDCVPTGSQFSRVQKTKLVAEYEASHRHLNVCVDGAYQGRNCSDCFKCHRTLLTLDLLGLADLYRNVFDLGKFEKQRLRNLLKTLTYRRGTFESEIAELVRAEGHGYIAYAYRLRHLLDRLIWD